MWANIYSITQKELRDYFSSSAALLFLAIFLVSAYIVFFWLEAFFARNLADVRPLFNWIPILFIFLISALTMHSWSEERRMGTIELVLTSAVSPWAFILGKFFAVVILILAALVLTLPLPITASTLGELDWGPVLGGYVAAVFLAAAYSAIGLWASCQTENQIVSLIISIVITGLLYIVGSTMISSLFTYEIAEFLRSLGSGARFESITRGVLDMRDIFYYLTIVILFLLFTRKNLESLRWANNFSTKVHSYWNRLTLTTITLLIAANIGLNFVTQARVDLTEGTIYSLSDASKDYIQELDETLLIRGYFSSSTHPLLAPLIPRIRDLLTEYDVQGKGNVKVEFIDPHEEIKFEQEAGIKYGIRPVSFHTESKYQASVINTYFNVLVAYQDQYEVLNYKDLVDLKSSAGKHEVDLNNPEYQITRTIRSITAKANRQVDSFANLVEPIVLTGYVSSYSILPNQYKKIIEIIEQLGDSFRQQSNENFDFLFINPDDDQLTQQYLQDKLGVQPITDNNINTQPYWFYFTLTDGKKTVPITFSSELDINKVKQSIFSAYKRLLPDSIKTIAIMRPLPTPGPAGISESPGIPKHFSILRKALQQSFEVIDVDLHDGVVPSKVNFLMVLAPRFLNPIQIDAIRKYLLSGGNILIASSSIDVNVSYFTEVYPVRSGLEPWLAELGITLGESLILDKQHGQYTLPVSRGVGEIRVRETSLVNYPYIIDVRGDGININSGITEKLAQIYMPWASPITLDNNLHHSISLTPLLNSSAQSWTSDSEAILPDFKNFPDTGFAKNIENSEPKLLAALLEGSFSSDQSQQSLARLIIISSGALFTDNFIDTMSQVLRSEYRRPIQFMQNLVDWSLEDQRLLGVLRKHSQFTRTLNTLDQQQKKYWEYINYILGALGLCLIGLVRIILNKRSQLKARKLLRS